VFIDVRTHLISLVAVFLALGIGILIGVDLVGGQGLTGSEKALVARLEQDFDRLRTQNQSLQAQLGQQARLLAVEDEFDSQVMAALVSGRLAGLRVAVVITQPGYQDAGLLAVLRQAGAALGPVLTLAAPSALDPPTWQAVEGTLGTKDVPTAYNRLAALTVQALAQGRAPAADVLRLPVWQVSGAVGRPVQGVVVVCGGTAASDPTLDDFTLPLVSDLVRAGVTVVGGETSNVPYSRIPDLEALGITTVDDLDLAPGLVSAVYGLAGVAGNYGIKPTSSTLMPSTVGTAP
jgi:hypothetical protein